MDTTEGNKIIAQFMGGIRECRHKELQWYTWSSMEGRPPVYTEEGRLEYHSSWDWLMPVVGKIESLTVTESTRGEVNYVVTIEENYCVISVGGEQVFAEFQSETSKIDAVYNCIQEFFKRYYEPKHYKKLSTIS